MPLDPSISLNVQTPDPLTKISAMLSAARSAQALKSEQLGYQTAQATQAADIANQQAISSQNQTAAQLAKNRLQPDTDVATAAAQVAKGTAQPQIDITQQQAEQARLRTAHDTFGLQGEYAQKALDVSNAYANDPDFMAGNSSKMIGKLAEARQQMIAAGVPPERAEFAISNLIQQAALNPKGVRQTLLNHQQIGIGAQGQVQQSQVPIAQQQALTTDTAGNPAVVNRDASGQITMKGVPIVGQQAQTMPTRALAPGEKEMIPQLATEYTNARNTYLNAGTSHAINQGILSEIDKTTTGTLGPFLQRLNSTVGGLGFGTPEETASSYDKIGKYLERQALVAAQSMGPQTNAGLESQIKANGSVHYNPTAIKAITKLNDALTTGSEKYFQGLQRAMSSDPQSGVLTKNGFDAQWGSVFTPTVMQLYNAVKKGDKAEIDEILKTAGPAGQQDLLQRAKAIDQLVTTGHL